MAMQDGHGPITLIRMKGVKIRKNVYIDAYLSLKFQGSNIVVLACCNGINEMLFPFHVRHSLDRA
jgi:hypothetical protein